MQGAMCLAKFEQYPDAHDKQRYDLGVLLGNCRAQSCQLMESQRYMFIIFTFNVLFVLQRIIEVMCSFHLLSQKNFQDLVLKFCLLSKKANT